MICRRIKELREDKDLTQKTVGAALGISQRCYAYYENGERTIPLEILCALADFHKVTVDYLLNRD